MWSSVLVWELGIPAPIYVLLVFATFLLQQHERSYNLHRCSSVSLRWAGTSGFRFATVGAPSVPFGSRVRWESSKASGSRPESCLFSLVLQPLFPESDSRWKVASCWGVVCLTGLFVVGDQFRYGFHSSVVDSMPLIGVSWIRVYRRGSSQRHTPKLRWHDRLCLHSGLTLLLLLGRRIFGQRGGDGTPIEGIHDSLFPPVASVTVSVISSQTTFAYVLKPRRMGSS